jgi:hypothetical protein
MDNNEDVIDSRDVIERIAELEDMNPADFDAAPELRDELHALLALADEASQYADDWKYGSVLVRDSYFTEYAEQLAEDLGMVSRDLSWPLNRIDWDAAADDLKIDYTSVDFDGVTYWIR